MFAVNADGTGLTKLTVSKDGKWDPFLLEDGTIGFTRWEYVMKFWSPIQMIWSVRPDGTECDPGEPGELVHRGSLVAMGYWNDPERSVYGKPDRDQ